MLFLTFKNHCLVSSKFYMILKLFHLKKKQPENKTKPTKKTQTATCLVMLWAAKYKTEIYSYS